MISNQSEAAVVFSQAPPQPKRVAGNPEIIPGTVWHDEEFRDWPPLEWPAEPIRPPAPTPRSVWLIRVLIGFAAVALVLFFIWLLDAEKRGDAWLFWPLFAAMTYRALWWIVEWTNYGRPKVEPFEAPKRQWTVDVLTTACPGEPRGMILRTLLAMKAIRYPHTDYLCDEGNDPVLREACEALGIRHVTRVEKTHAKAGNINNALEQATGEIAVVLDPDHEPSPYMLDRLLGYFEDPTVGFVQSVQAYRNQGDSLVADGAAKQTYLFYGPVMIGMNAYGTTQAIGANCVFRRAALDSIGGHAAGLSEDMHTTMRLYSRGWRSVYVPEILTRGLVPSTLSAYCKQQVKWACGSIELLLQEYPKLFRGMTGWQQMHYLFAPLYFLRGFFGAINILVPIVCLIFGGVALRIDLIEYLAAFLPVVIIAGVIRQRTQHWTIEKSDRGAHLMGGILGMGCWWVFLRGALCALFRIKLPYIPTPKGNEAHDSWGLAAPNLIAAAASVGAAAYGLYRDWTPFSWMMAAFALWNAAQLTFVAALGQQHTLQRIAYFFSRRDWIGRLFSPLEKLRFRLHTGVLSLMREHPSVIALVVIAAAISVFLRPRGIVPADDHATRVKDTGGFYVGARFSDVADPHFPAAFESRARELGANFRLFPFILPWGSEDEVPFPRELMRTARLRGAVPLLTWEPTTANFPKLPGMAGIGGDHHIFAAILDGKFDDYLIGFANRMRDFGDPVLIRFAPEPDNPARPWSRSGMDAGEEYTDAWDYVVAIFNNVGASNVGWVWQPASPNAFQTHFPKTSSVDWIGLDIANRGKMNGGAWYEFAELYRPFREKIAPLQLPVLLTEFGTTVSGGDNRAWLRRALAGIASDFSEIRGIILSPDRGWFADPAPETTRVLAKGLAHPALRAMPPPPLIAAPSSLWAERVRPVVRSPAIRGSSGKYEFVVNGAPFYVRGVAYNPGHDWRDGFVPLTRRELEGDFDRLRATGANTIRRYGSNWYDRNILRVAAEKDLKVLFGFWLEQHVDYRCDAAKLSAYTAQVERTVLARRDESAVIAWSLGNEVWGLLKHRYAQPYLTEVRHAHVDFVERLARRIHELDPQRPIFTAHEHSPHLAGSLADFARGAPSLDFTAINSYYEERTSQLARIVPNMDTTRPYLISEFGPDGYWETRPTQRNARGALIEPDSDEKVQSYARAWAVHTEAHRGANIGGVAYCWRDRYEATATWFGLTDSDGRLKPAGLALQQLWTGRAASGPRVLALEGPNSPVAPGATINVRAQVRGKPGQHLTYKWRLASEDFDFKVGNVEGARITLPQRPGTYRVYFSASDGISMDEANFPVHVTTDTSSRMLVPPELLSTFSRRRVVGP